MNVNEIDYEFSVGHYKLFIKIDVKIITILSNI